MVKEQFRDHISILLNTLRDRGQLRRDIDTDVAAKTIKYVASEVFRRYVINDNSSLEDAADELNAMLKFVVGLAVIR